LKKIKKISNIILNLLRKTLKAATFFGDLLPTYEVEAMVSDALLQARPVWRRRRT
jgi:hypothetical protein